MTSPQFKQLTPVLVVDRIEPCLSFWTGLGFTATTKVPGPDNKLAFVILQKDAVEVMYQTRASVIAERPDAANEPVGHAIVLFVVVVDLDAVVQAVKKAPLVKGRHHTFYGSTEIYVREPGGNVVGFAQME
jgi:hypothetical protein